MITDKTNTLNRSYTLLKKGGYYSVFVGDNTNKGLGGELLTCSLKIQNN
jgi:hypothetical protein